MLQMIIIWNTFCYSELSVHKKTTFFFKLLSQKYYITLIIRRNDHHVSILQLFCNRHWRQKNSDTKCQMTNKWHFKIFLNRKKVILNFYNIKEWCFTLGLGDYKRPSQKHSKTNGPQTPEW